MDKTTEFINLSKEIHKNKYSYDKTVYVNNLTKVIITCPEHGDFEQTPKQHKRGQGCPKCSKNCHRNREEWIVEANRIHNNKYSYDLIPEHFLRKDYIDIICKRHGVFKCQATRHMQGDGCPKCKKKYDYLPEEYIKLAEEIYNVPNKIYSYEQTNFIQSSNKIDVICLKHGLFRIYPIEHLKGHGCPQCSKEIGFKKYTRETFIEKCKFVHRGFYNYNETYYDDNKSTEQIVDIICPIHGKFKQKATHHIFGKGCQKCAKIYHYTTEEWIEKANKIHKNKYSYEYTEYINCKTNVIIICPIHGIFEMNPSCHLKGYGCPQCSHNYPLSLEEFKRISSEIHNNKYSYELIDDFQNKQDIVEIICPEHGKFRQAVYLHVNGSNCPKCVNCYTYSKEELLRKFREIHGYKYQYDFTNYVSHLSEIEIECPEHGIFRQAVRNHLKGNGCPVCKESNLEKSLRIVFEQQNIEYEREKTFDWLLFSDYQRIDFYIPTKNIAIECQGKQHFTSIDFFGGEERFQYIVEADENKRVLCKENNVDLIYYLNEDVYNMIDPIEGYSYFTSTEDIVDYINKKES